MASTTALPPPTSLNKARGRPTSSAGCFATRPVPVTSSAGCFATRPVLVPSSAGRVYYKACAGQLHHRPVCYNGLVLPCLAMPCLPALALAPCLLALFAFAPSIHYHVRQDHRVFCRDCPVGSSITGLHWRPVHRVFHPSIHPSIHSLLVFACARIIARSAGTAL